MSRIQRHFQPVTARSVFSPERLLTPPPSTARKVFPVADSPPEETSRLSALELVGKPVGEVGKAYDLQEASSLDLDTFKKIEVCSSHHFGYNNIKFSFQTHINQLVKDNLNTAATYIQQDRNPLSTVLKAVS